MTPQLDAVLVRARRAPFYNGRKLESFATAPITSKQDLRSAYPLGLLAVPKDQIATYHESSGTSGQPISSYFTDRDWQDIATRFLRSDVRLTSSDMVMVKTPYALVTTAHQMHLAARTAGAAVVPADNRSHNMPYTRVIRLLRDLPITVTWSLPTEVLLWAFVAKKMGYRPETDFPHLRAFLVAGESLSPARKRMLSKVWGGKRIVEDYGSTETGSLAGECHSGKMHLWSDRLHFEVRDEESREIREFGTGSLLVTPLYREAMPLVRYDLGDQVRISSEACACGSKLPTVEVLGRESAIVRVGGRLVHARDLEEIIYADFETTRILFWRARVKQERLEIEITAERPLAVGNLEKAIHDRLGIRVEARAVESARFFPTTMLKNELESQMPLMQKPRFLFAADEDWNRGITYV